MQSHDDAEHLNAERREFMDKLRQRAFKMTAEGKSEITGGKVGEQPLDGWKSNKFHVQQMPDDEQGILRISIGGGITIEQLNYLVFRGDRLACLNLLRTAVKALEKRP